MKRESAGVMWVACGPAAVVAALLISGCNDDRPATAPTMGTVYLDDKPLADAQLTFLPERGKLASATTAADGTFALTTYKQGDGAVSGRHLATVQKYENPPQPKPAGGSMGPLGLPAPPGKSLIPDGYGNTATSGLQYEIIAGQENVLDIRLSSRHK